VPFDVDRLAASDWAWFIGLTDPSDMPQPCWPSFCDGERLCSLQVPTGLSRNYYIANPNWIDYRSGEKIGACRAQGPRTKDQVARPWHVALVVVPAILRLVDH